ncbi:MAG: toll/interleukin-1 receptor domain-containing protein [Silvibacterium sp.]|nr:toll/interleukin-1 receptor domain-containing protein [Silvibacterium sp.]
MAGRLRTALEEEGMKVWTDRDALQAGENWEGTLSGQLNRMDAVIFLIGPDGRVGEEQRDEATAVFRAEWESPKKIPLIPVVTTYTDLPPFLKEVQAIEVSDVENGWSEAAKKIKQTLGAADSTGSVPASGENEQQTRLLEIQRFADSLKAADSREKLAR